MKVVEAEQQIRDIIEAGIDVYVEAIKNDPYLFRSTYHYLNYSEDAELKNKRREFLKSEPLQKNREMKLYKLYENLVLYSKTSWNPLVVFRNCKILVEWEKYWHLCLGIEDYEKDKEVYRSSIYVNQNTHPLLYKYILGKKHIHNLKSL